MSRSTMFRSLKFIETFETVAGRQSEERRKKKEIIIWKNEMRRIYAPPYTSLSIMESILSKNLRMNPITAKVMIVGTIDQIPERWENTAHVCKDASNLRYVNDACRCPTREDGEA